MLKIFVVFLLILFNWKRLPIYTTLPCRYLSTFSKIKKRFHPLAYICTIKILFLISKVQVVNIWPCNNNLENNHVFSWGQTRAFMFFLFPYFLLFFLNSKPLAIFLCWQKNLHVWEDLCWMLKILQLQYHQPRVLTVLIMSISLNRVFIVHCYHYKSSCVKVNCSNRWWMAMARSVCYFPSLKRVCYGICMIQSRHGCNSTVQFSHLTGWYSNGLGIILA